MNEKSEIKKEKQPDTGKPAEKRDSTRRAAAVKAKKETAAKRTAPEKSAQPERVEEFVRQKLEQTAATENEPSGETVDLTKIKKQFKKKRSHGDLSAEQAKRYSPDLNTGLTTAQVNERFSQFLFNDTNQKYSKSYASIFIGNLCTFFNLLCVLAAVALAYSGAPLSQYFFVVIFSLNLGFGIVVEIRAKRKIDKLSLLTVPTAQVIRNGGQTEIHAKDIVLDDIVCLSLGNQIPADCIVAEGSVEVNEALLTGESVPVKKEVGDFLYAGSFISSGSCKARADKVGKNTSLTPCLPKRKSTKSPIPN